MPKAGDVIADKYTIEQLIGVGGMGAVFSAAHKFTGKRVALKWMLPELANDADAVRRFMREAHASGRISHPNVVDIYDVGQHAGSYFLVMEYLQGEPLTSALARRDLTATETLNLLLPAMRGVAAAHRQGVIHRDLKPDNIFLAYEEDGVGRQPKVLDFGISKLSGEGIDMRLTRTGAVVGTPYYMSPEQIRGSAELDKRSDIYSFGVIVYEALTGRVPFHADTYGALVLEIATSTPLSPTDLVVGLPRELSRIVLRAMARDVGQRYADMESFIRALEPFTLSSSMRGDRRDPTGSERLESTRPSAAPPVPTVARLASTPFAAEVPQPPRISRTSTGVALFAGAAVLLVGAIWFFTRVPETAPNQRTSAARPASVVARPNAPVPPPSAAVPTLAPQPAEIAPPQAEAVPVFSPHKNLLPDAGEPQHSAPHGKPTTRKRTAEPEPHAPRVTQPMAAPTRKARSGSMSFDDF